jgi:hypothetical protein
MLGNRVIALDVPARGAEGQAGDASIGVSRGAGCEAVTGRRGMFSSDQASSSAQTASVCRRDIMKRSAWRSGRVLRAVPP